MITKIYRSIGVIVLGCICMASAVSAQANSNHARTILTEMLAKYEHAESYQDIGTLRGFARGRRSLLDAQSPPEHNRVVVSFRIFFSRPQSFRFDWRNSLIKTSREAVVWWNGEQGFSWAPDPAIRKDRFDFIQRRDLGALITDTINPSRGVVVMIPGLLIKTLEPYTFADHIRDMLESRIVKEQLVDGEMCYVITGKVLNVPWFFWIGKKSLLLRKMRSFASTGSFDESLRKRQPNRLVVEERHLNIRMNDQIPEQIFRYQPRLRAGDTDLTH